MAWRKESKPSSRGDFEPVNLKERALTALRHSSRGKRRFATEDEIAQILIETESFPIEIRSQMAKDLSTFPLFDAMAMWADMAKMDVRVTGLVRDFVDREPLEITPTMTKTTNFESACKSMGHRYSSEIGLLEPDVGGDFLDSHEARKEWCSISNKQKNYTIFNAPGDAEFQFDAEQDGKGIRVSPTSSINFDLGVKKEFTEKNICFRNESSQIQGVNKVCVDKEGNITFPESQLSLFKDSKPITDYNKIDQRNEEVPLQELCDKMRNKVSSTKNTCVLRQMEDQWGKGGIKEPITIEQVGNKVKVDLFGVMKGEISERPLFYRVKERFLFSPGHEGDNLVCITSKNPKRGDKVDGLAHVCISDGYWTLSFPEWGWLE